jgi:glycosyltransferase involved in cell wall biosynthesis
LYESDLVENPVEPWSRAMTRDDFDAPLALRGVRLLGNVAKSVRGLAKLTSVIQRGGFDLLYCNGTNACFAGGALSYTTKVPALWHVRYTSVPPALRAVHNQLAASKGVARIVCVSKAAQSLFPHAVAMGKTRVIHNALDASEFESSKVEGILRKELGLADDVVLFGSQGRILPRKGYVEMVRAAELALREMTAAERTKVHFAVLGDTPEDIRPDHLAECRALVRELGLEKCFTFLGFRDDVKPYVADFDVAVVPSVYPDPLPRAVIESMAMGKPVVAFDVGGVAEMLEHGVTGSLVRGTPPDVAGMAETFVRYLRHPAARAAEGRAARIRIEKDFDSRAQSRKIQNEIVRTSGLATNGTAEA